MLTPTQLTAIDQHLRKENWLLNEDLIAELKDHYAEGLAERLAQGMAFEVALRDIHTGFGGRKGLLKMEENYQKQNALKVDVYVWREVRTFFKAPKITISVLLLVCMYWLNAYSGIHNDVDAFFSVGLFMMTASIVSPLMSVIIFFILKRHQDIKLKLLLWPTTISFYILYTIGLGLRLVSTYNPSLDQVMSSTFRLWGSSLVETLTIIYSIATVVGLRKLLLNSIKLA